MADWLTGAGQQSGFGTPVAAARGFAHAMEACHDRVPNRSWKCWFEDNGRLDVFVDPAASFEGFRRGAAGGHR